MQPTVKLHRYARLTDKPSAAWPARAAMGLVALFVILLLEAALATLGFGQTLAQHLAAYAETGPQLGLAAQLMFAAIPLVRRQ